MKERDVPENIRKAKAELAALGPRRRLNPNICQSDVTKARK